LNVSGHQSEQFCAHKDLKQYTIYLFPNIPVGKGNDTVILVPKH